MKQMIEYLPTYLTVWIKILRLWWPVIVFGIWQLVKLWRWESEQKRVQADFERDKLKRKHNKKHPA